MARIVVIDDAPTLMRSFVRLLRAAGHDVQGGVAFDEVEVHLHPGGFDILFSDILMPDKSGTEILRELNDRGCFEPVVLITGDPNLETASQAVRLGAFDYLTKPVTKQRLLDVVARAIRHLELVRERDRARDAELQILRNLARVGESAAWLAHEIKTPITNLHVALRAVAGHLDAEHEVVIGELVERLEQIGVLMRRVLEFGRPLEPRTRTCRIDAILAEVEAHWRSSEAGAPPGFDVRAEAPEPVHALADPLILVQALDNLLRNSAEACGAGGRARISAHRNGASRVVVRVDDDGPGIPVEDRARLFRLFHSTKRDGTGCGLAMCRKFLEAQGGTIELVHGRFGGACFEITLPAADRGEEAR